MTDKSNPPAEADDRGAKNRRGSGSDSNWAPCQCAEARLLRDVLSGRVPGDDGPGWAALMHLVEVAAVRQLRLMSHDLSGARDWRAFASRHTTHTELARRRGDYEVPAWAVSGNEMLARRRGSTVGVEPLPGGGKP